MSELEKKLEILMSQHDQETYWSWIQACRDAREDLNEWEQGFIDSLYYKMEKNKDYFFTPRQVEHLERIYAEKTK